MLELDTICSPALTLNETDMLTQSSVRRGTLQFLGSWKSVCSHGQQALLRADLPTLEAPALAHDSGLGNLDNLDSDIQRRSLCACRRRADLQLPNRHRGESVRRVVHVWYCRHVLAPRLVPHRIWLCDLEAEVVSS